MSDYKKTTTIAISIENHRKLMNLGKKGESFDDIITRLLDKKGATLK